MNEEHLSSNNRNIEKHSAAFDAVEKIILEGIEKSKTGGYKVVKVTFMRPVKESPGQFVETTMPLHEFWGMNSLHTLLDGNMKEFNELLTKYNKPEFVRQPFQKTDSVRHTMGSTATTGAFKPYEGNYRDPKMAAAKDDS